VWDPSQNAPFSEFLQPHHATVFVSVTSSMFGVNPVPLCDPSQYGWLLLSPQEHHAYLPGVTSITNGAFCAIFGLLIILCFSYLKQTYA